MIKTLIFDFDGVIVESMDIKTTAFARLFASEGDETVQKVVTFHKANGGMSRFDKFRHFYCEFLHRGLSDQEFDRLCREFSQLVMEEVVAAPYVPGAIEFLSEYSNRIPCFIASATPEDELTEIVRRRNLNRYFKGAYGAPRTKAGIISSILNEMSILPNEALFIGDAMNDYLAARQCGVIFVGRETAEAGIFEGIDCRKIPDLFGLSNLLQDND